MRILVTNDDGVSAPGLAALTRALVAWADRRRAGDPAHEIIVVAPSSNYSGAGAAVGSVTDHTTIPYQRAYVEGAEAVEAYGLDASPALSVIAGALGAVGPKPDLVLSGINDGVNVGRSVLHSGTVGAALTASQLGISALAVSLRVGDGPDPWESAAELAVALIPLLVAAPVRTVLNLNVPHLPAGGDPGPALGPGEWRRADQVGPGRRELGGAQRRGDRGAGRGRGGPRPSWRASRTRRARSCSPSDRPSPTRATSVWPTPAPRTPPWWPRATPRSPRSAAPGPRTTRSCWASLDAGLAAALAGFGLRPAEGSAAADAASVVLSRAAGGAS